MTSDDVRAIVRRGVGLLDVGRPREALPILHEALRIDPDNLSALASIARAHLALKDLRTALTFADSAVRVAPENEWGHRLRSIILQQAGRLREALDAATQAITLAPDNEFVLHQLFSASRAMGRLLETWNIAHRMLAVAPDSSSSHINVGLAHLDYHQLDEAEAAFRRALAIEPDSWVAVNNLGTVLQRRDRMTEAMELYYRAAQINPAPPIPRNNLFKAANRYRSRSIIAIGVVLVVAVIVVGSALDLPDDRFGILLWSSIALAVAFGFFDRRRRLRSLGAAIERAVSDEQRMRRRRNTHRGVGVAFVLFAVFVLLPIAIGMFDDEGSGRGTLVIAAVIEGLFGAWWWYTRPPKL